MIRNFILLLTIFLMLGCASKGHLNYNDKIYDLNRSDIIQEQDGKHRISVWRYERGESFNIVGGSSPVGVQLLIPAVVYPDMTCTIGKDCMLWVRGQESELLRVLFGLKGRWIGADNGMVTITEWGLKDRIIAGSFTAQVEGKSVSGDFCIKPKEKEIQ